MRLGTTGYMGRRVKVLSVDETEQYWLPNLEKMLSVGYKVVRVDKLTKKNKGEALIYILENEGYRFGDQCD